MRVMAVCLGLLAALVLVAPAPALANCAAACQTQSSSCRKRCGADKKFEAECLKNCAEQARLCPPMCEVGRKNKKDPQRLQQESKALYQRMRSQENAGHR